MSNINQFIGILTDTYGDNVWRKIEVWRNDKGKKTTACAHSNWSKEQIADDKGRGNCYDIYVKHCSNDDGKLVCLRTTMTTPSI